MFNSKVQVGQVGERVEVQDLAPSVDLATSTIGGVVGQEAVEQLPLNGRDWTSLATLQPGVDSVGSIQANTGGPGPGRRGYGGQNENPGLPPPEKHYRLHRNHLDD